MEGILERGPRGRVGGGRAWGEVREMWEIGEGDVLFLGVMCGRVVGGYQSWRLCQK